MFPTEGRNEPEGENVSQVSVLKNFSFSEDFNLRNFKNIKIIEVEEERIV